MFLVTFWQIVARFLPGESTVWSEEVSRFLFVWIVFLGAGTLMRDEEHIRIGVLTDRLGRVSSQVFRIFSAILVIPFLVIFTCGGYQNMISQWNTFAPTVDWLRLGYVYLSLVISGVLMMFYLFRNLYREILRYPSKSKP
jgi:TRAP-type C4-dicarboxylate transport system permease small subunit